MAHRAEELTRLAINLAREAGEQEGGSSVHPSSFILIISWLPLPLPPLEDCYRPDLRQRMKSSSASTLTPLAFCGMPG